MQEAQIYIVLNSFQNGIRYTVWARRLASIHFTNKCPDFVLSDRGRVGENPGNEVDLNRPTSDKFKTFSSNCYQHHNFYNLLMSSSGKKDVTCKLDL